MSGDDAAAKTGKIAVWWDMKDCPVTEGIDAHRVRPSIEGGFRELGYSGPVSIKAYGDQKRTPDHLLQALSSTGVAVVHIRSESTCALMYNDMVKWREDNLPPATMMIITNQILDVFQLDLARLQQRTRYDLFLAYSVKPRAELYLATREVWLWEKLLLGTTTSTSADTAGELSIEVLYPQPTQLLSVTFNWGKNYAATPENATAKIHVFWDMFDCPIPGGYDPRRVRPSLEGAFKKLGYSGPVSITAYGDHKQTSDVHLQALSTTGIDVAHVIPEKIFSLMYDDLMDWQDDNPAPAIIMLISDEPVDFLGDILALLQQQQKYNLFWAYSFRPREMSIMLTSAEWLWDRLLA
uniref:NYN domain-containing protein n=1 Tax=Brassica oleracea var. oleracea TaxID=109376 RepID=A0A0D3C5Y2_BRAOL